MSSLPVLMEVADDGIATITLNRPERLNAFDRSLCEALNGAVLTACDDDGIRVVVLAGSGKAFSSGADLKSGFDDPRGMVERLNADFLPALDGLRRMPKPVIAAVEGAAAGIGVAYLLACDLAIMGEDAYLMLPFVNIGLVPDGGISWDLVRRLGHQRAYELMVTGERLEAARCLELGLANRLAAPGQAGPEARAWARELLQRAPLALRHAKRAARDNAELGFRDAFQREAELQELCYASEDFREGVAAFVDKRPPRFRGC